MGKRLNDLTRKHIQADYVETQNLSETARKFKVDVVTVKNIVEEDKENISNKIKAKKEENTQSVLEYMESKAQIKKDIISMSLERLKEKIQKDELNPNDLIRVYGVMIDKELGYKAVQKDNNIDELNNNILNIAKILNNPVEDRMEDSINDKNE